MAKLIVLATAAHHAAIGRSLMPCEGPQIVDDETAAEWEAEGLLAAPPEDMPADVEEIVDVIVEPPLAPARTRRAPAVE